MKKTLKIILFVDILILGQSCSGFLPDRSFIEEMNRESDSYLEPGKDFRIVSGDSGESHRSPEEIQKRTPASKKKHQKTREEDSIKDELEQKTKDIPEEQLGQYIKDKKYLQSESDKLYYLSLPPEERGNYISNKKQDLIDSESKNQDFIEKRSIHNSELSLGMDKKQVIQSWGRPSRIEIAGNPKNQNEKWIFLEDGNSKQIYFENGKLQGWALDL